MPERRIKYIYWFAYYNFDSPSVRYRAKYPLDFARENLDIKSRLIIPGYSPKRLVGFIRAYLRALLFPKKNSLIVIQRLRSNFIYANLLKLLVIIRRKQSVYDLDDADYLEHNPGTIHFFARRCNYISAGSPAIANYLRQFNRNVIHITSPTPDYAIVKNHRNKTFTVGWVGSFGGGHKESLYKYLFPALRDLPFDCQLTIIGATKKTDEKEIRSFFKNHSNIKVVVPGNIDWQDEKGLQSLIKQFDLGIATLLNHPVQLAKSGIKAKQYMNNGVPVLCNDLPENDKVVIDGFNGFVCDSVSEFTNRLREFHEMGDDQYWKFSQNARRSRKHFNHWRYFEALEKLTNETQHSPVETGKVALTSSE